MLEPLSSCCDPEAKIDFCCSRNLVMIQFNSILVLSTQQEILFLRAVCGSLESPSVGETGIRHDASCTFDAGVRSALACFIATADISRVRGHVTQHQWEQ